MPDVPNFEKFDPSDFEMDSIDLTTWEISTEALASMRRDEVVEHCVIPIEIDTIEMELIIAVPEETTLYNLDSLSVKDDYTITAVLASRQSILDAIEQNYPK